MKSSLFTLFKRGRYFRLPLSNAEDTIETVKARREAERFAAAAIGFCMFHDRPFRRFFVQSVCGIVMSVRAKIEVEIEPESWADLLIYLPNRICVVEFKIGAPLQPHQNPSNDAFWEERLGYGAKIENVFKGRKKHFVVLGHRRYLHFPDRPNWSFAQPGWEHVANGFQNGLQKRRLLRDLRDSLAQLGLWEFSSMKSREIGSIFIDRVSIGSIAWNVLWDIFTHPQLDFTTGVTAFRHESAWSSRNSWYFGIEIERNANRALANFLRPKSKGPMMWFGYECERRDKDCQSLWFYCENEDIAAAVEQNMRPEKFSRDRVSRRPDEKDERTYVCLQGQAGYGKSQFDWFLEKLMQARSLETRKPLPHRQGKARVRRRTKV